MSLSRPNLDAAGMRFALVVSRYNEFVTEKLVEGALDTLRRHGADEKSISQYVVPGAWEIPIAAQRAASRKDYDAIICIGCVIRGQTPHFDYVAGGAATGAMRVSLDAGIPVTFGVITADTTEQAMDRAGGKVGNKGAEAAVAAIETVALLRGIEQKRR